MHVGRAMAVTRCARRQADAPASIPDVSVVVYASAAALHLAETLPLLLEQRYDGKFEIIVVNDGSDLATEHVLLSLEQIHPNLRHTFAPPQTRALSRRKLATTLGVKAARHEIVLLTSADARPQSDRWLHHMAVPFADPAIEMVLGHAVPADEMSPARTAIDALRSHRRTLDAVGYLNAAIGGDAYRGTADNMAFRRQKFFDLKGFSNSFNLRGGIDDVFVSDAATRGNTAVVLCREAILATVPDDSEKEFRQDCLLHAYTAPYCSRRPRGRLAAWRWMPVVQTVALVVAVAAGVATRQYALVSAIAGAVLLLAMWIPMIVAYDKASRALRGRRFRVTVVTAVLAYPFRKLVYRLRCGRSHKTQMTLQAIGEI